MQLNKIKGNTYYIDAPTNSGVFMFKNKNCIIVDTGVGNGQAKRMDEILSESGLHPKYIINTHSHLDHCGGNAYFREAYPGCLVYSSEEEKLYMENPSLYSTILFSSSPIKELYRKHKPLIVDYTIEPGINKINDEKLEVIPLRGHSSGQIGVITPDKVCFLGDSIFSRETINKYSLPYLFNIGESIDTLNAIKTIDADYFVASHNAGLIEKSEIKELAELNIANIHYYKDQILELLDQPLTREDILENLVILNDLSLNFTQYHLYLSSVSAYVAFLFENTLITYSIENGRTYYYKSK